MTLHPCVFESGQIPRTSNLPMLGFALRSREVLRQNSHVQRMVVCCSSLLRGRRLSCVGQRVGACSRSRPLVLRIWSLASMGRWRDQASRHESVTRMGVQHQQEGRRRTAARRRGVCGRGVGSEQARGTGGRDECVSRGICTCRPPDKGREEAQRPGGKSNIVGRGGGRGGEGVAKGGLMIWRTRVNRMARRRAAETRRIFGRARNSTEVRGGEKGGSERQTEMNDRAKQQSGEAFCGMVVMWRGRRGCG